MIYWPLFWKELTLRRKAWIQTPFEVIVMAYTIFSLQMFHSQLSQEIERTFSISSAGFKDSSSSAFMNTIDYFFAYYPSTQFTEEIMNDRRQPNKHGLMIDLFSYKASVTTVALKSEAELYNLVVKYYTNVLVAFTFYEKNSGRYLTNKSKIEDGIHIKVRPTFLFGGREYSPDTEEAHRFAAYGHYLQWIEKNILEFVINGKISPQDFGLNIRGQEGPTIFRFDLLPDTIMLALGTVLTLYVLVKRMVTEKATKLRELMRLSGVENTPYYVTLFTVHFVIIWIYSLICMSLYTDICDGVTLLIVYTLFAISSVLFTMAFTTVFNSKTVGNTAFVIVWLGLPSILFFYLILPSNNYENEIYCFVGCIFAPPTYAIGMFKQLCVSRIFQTGKSLSLDKLSSTLDNQMFLSPLMVILALILSSVVWLMWLLYVGEIWPWQEGIPRPWHFPISYFFKQTKERSQKVPPKNKEYFEVTPSELKCAISVENVRKRFGFSKDVLKGVNLEIFHGQITILLGHNGAGKTTLMSIMTGLFPASAGRITINGFDVEKHTNEARKSVGLCTQANTQFEQFTIEEHLYFFGLIKGCSLTDIGPEIDRVLKLLTLEDKRYEKPSNISGGMKRKLQIGIAFIGGSTVLILDEPSAGLDVETRRVIWDMLLAVRRKYVILITTHHMEEADCLGDRIAIMSHGEVKCCGTPIFLKRTFGVGYFIRIAKATQFVRMKCEVALRRHLRSVKLQKDTTSEIVYSFKKEETSNLPDLFDEFENPTTKKGLGISSVGISVTSMDDVFLKVGQIFDKSDPTNAPKPSLTDLILKEPHSKSALKALLLKRFHNLKRQPLTVAFFIGLITLATLMMAFYTDRASKPVSREWSINLNFAAMGLQSKRAICFNHKVFCEKAKKIGHSFNINIEFANITFEKFNTTVNEDVIFTVLVEHFDVQRTTNIDHSITISARRKEPLVLMIARTILINTMYAVKKDSNNVLITTSFNPQKTVNLNYIPPIGWLILIPLMFLIPCVYALLYPSAEAESNVKLLQMMTGIHVVTYWIANLIFDMLLIIVYSLPFFLIIAFYFFAFNCITVAYDFTSLVIFVTVMLIFFFATTTMSHLLSFLFNGLAIVFMILVGTSLSLTFLQFLPFRPVNSTAKFLSDTLVPKFPLMAMYHSVVNVSLYSHTQYYCDDITSLWPVYCNTSADNMPLLHNQCCTDKSSDYLDINLLTEELLQVGLAIAFFVAVIFVEVSIDWSKRKRTEDHIYRVPDKEDSDVTSLRSKTEAVFANKEHEKFALTTCNVTKRFGPKTVVDHLSFVVEHKLCFGLLGVNGAGKTTTFKMLIGDERMTYGASFVNGVSVFDPSYAYRMAIGYCPQFDAFVSNLTGREMLYLFARLRGYTGKQLRNAVEKMIEFVDLQDHASFVADNYSGGNKRKLSIGIAMIGFPSLLFLDEPTAGVDPVARRKVWKVIETCRETVGSSIVLTSHSMDECEQLCSIIGIMVKGTFRCIGSTQHLKSKFGKGYTITFKIDAKRDNANDVNAEMEKLLPKAQLKDSHTTLLVYHFEDTSVTLGNVFRILESIKSKHQLEDYQLTDADLEQIFLGFARGD